MRQDSSIDPDMEVIPLRMVREHLRRIPVHPLPAGYSMRAYRRGDKKTWLRIHDQAEPIIKVTSKTFDDNFGCNLAAMPKRCFFVVGPDGSDVGTITSWYVRRYRTKRWGRIHWVAIVPAHRGKGLAKAIMTVAMQRMRKLGHRRAMLTTATARLAAIKTYLHFGFVPDMTSTDARRAWSLVTQKLNADC